MKIDFDPNEHKYRVDGRPVPSVTALIKGAHDFSGIPEPVLEFARERGSAVHKAVDLDVQGVLDVADLDERILPYFQQWRSFIRDSGFMPLLAELQVASSRFGFAGTLDLQGVFLARPDRIALVDLKATAALPFTVGPQTSAYERALAETIGCPAAAIDRYCLHLMPTRYRLVPLRNPRDWPFFLAALTLRSFLDEYR